VDPGSRQDKHNKQKAGSPVLIDESEPEQAPGVAEICIDPERNTRSRVLC
jgi:hypothetical protein